MRPHHRPDCCCAECLELVLAPVLRPVIHLVPRERPGVGGGLVRTLVVLLAFEVFGVALFLAFRCAP